MLELLNFVLGLVFIDHPVLPGATQLYKNIEKWLSEKKKKTCINTGCFMYFHRCTTVPGCQANSCSPIGALILTSA